MMKRVLCCKLRFTSQVRVNHEVLQPSHSNKLQIIRFIIHNMQSYNASNVSNHFFLCELFVTRKNRKTLIRIIKLLNISVLKSPLSSHQAASQSAGQNKQKPEHNINTGTQTSSPSSAHTTLDSFSSSDK